MLMFIRRYIDNLTIDDLYNFALSKDINLDSKELHFLFDFIKKNYEKILENPNMDLSVYKNHFSDENFSKILNLANEYKIKYASFLK